MNDYGIENLRVKIGEIELTVELDSAYLNDFANASVYVVLPQVFPTLVMMMYSISRKLKENRDLMPERYAQMSLQSLELW